MPDTDVATRDDRPDDRPTRRPDGPLVTEHGDTSIADGVVGKIAGIAAREIAGVHSIGGGASRAVGAVRDRLPGQNDRQGRGIEVATEDQTARLSLSIVAEYGVSIADLAGGIRQNVISSVERMTGMQVESVHILVTDVFIPSQDGDAADTDR